MSISELLQIGFPMFVHVAGFFSSAKGIQIVRQPLHLPSGFEMIFCAIHRTPYSSMHSSLHSWLRRCLPRVRFRYCTVLAVESPRNPSTLFAPFFSQPSSSMFFPSFAFRRLSRCGFEDGRICDSTTRRTANVTRNEWGRNVFSLFIKSSERFFSHHRLSWLQNFRLLSLCVECERPRMYGSFSAQRPPSCGKRHLSVSLPRVSDLG